MYSVRHYDGMLVIVIDWKDIIFLGLLVLACIVWGILKLIVWFQDRRKKTNS